MLFSVLLSRHLMSRVETEGKHRILSCLCLKQWESLIASGWFGFRKSSSRKKEH